jgi:hypothetical protein
MVVVVAFLSVVSGCCFSSAVKLEGVSKPSWHGRARHAFWFENDMRGELKHKQADVRVFPPLKQRKYAFGGKKNEGNSLKKKHNLFGGKK